MERINQIMANTEYQKHLAQNEAAEQQRRFCRHNMAHSLDVARIAYILVLEAGLPIPKDVVYGTALLHDIGRHEQYETGMRHELASARIAEGILRKCGYAEEEVQEMLKAILKHRNLEDTTEPMSFPSLFYQADKRSRACYRCAVSAECNWEQDKKNHSITI